MLEKPEPEFRGKDAPHGSIHQLERNLAARDHLRKESVTGIVRCFHVHARAHRKPRRVGEIARHPMKVRYHLHAAVIGEDVARKA